jgi:SAM-dependent methyltransferase
MSDDDARFAGSIPQHYDQGLGPILFADYAADIARRVAALKPDRVLETAAGTGIVTRALRDALPPGARITATDLNPPMLAIAGAKFRPDERVTFQPADATALPFADGAFDAVVCQFGVMFFPDKDKAYREVHRVLAPGGRYLFSVWESFQTIKFAPIVYDLVARFTPDNPPHFMRVPFSYPFEPIKDSLLAAGFDDINVAVVRIAKAIPDVFHFARAQIYGSPLIDQVRARGVDPDAVVDALAQEFGAAFGDKPARMNLQALVVSAMKPADA